MARGVKLEVDTDLMNNCVWIVSFLTDEWDSDSSIGGVVCRYRDEATKLGRLWLHNKVHTIEDLEFAHANLASGSLDAV